MMDAFPGDWLGQLLGHWEYLVLLMAATAVLSSVAFRFLEKAAAEATPVSKERNAMATLSMTLFFFAIYYVGWFNVGRVATSPATETAAKIAGCLLVLGGAVINVAARRTIGRFWSDQIEIQQDHRVVRAWPYTWARHPMYGSLVLFGVGMGLLAVNPVVIGATLAIFLPAMAYRAVREERNLEAACGDDYRQFQQSVPMMLLRLPECVSRPARGGLAVMQGWGLATRDLELFVLSAILTLGLSFVMKRRDFRIAYKIKPVVILLCVALAALDRRLFVLLLIPTFASLMSLSGHCPGTLLLKLFGKDRTDGKPV